MKINVHAGHNPDGKKACGAAGFIRESTEARRVKDGVISQLRQLGHIVYDCTCEIGANQSDVLNRIVKSCNAHEVDLDVSIHFNSGAGDAAGNGKTTGTEAWIYSVPDDTGADAETAVGDEKQIYRVSVVDQRGAFSIRENAERMQRELKAAGFNAVITTA